MTESCFAVGNLQAEDIIHSAMDGQDKDYLQEDLILDEEDNSFYGVARKANINQKCFALPVGQLGMLLGKK
ncbi:MAG: hypothetical protein EZS28_011548 [Streblomastix strix]|uniref:Uncharacterized protein n=1 Tax=Streblomastix strix TaxID=222440 RepID=A0A5J4WEE1_9EUKA|nr:MAG: hypothetical protein EZS28_011548 [Streblomastix strix]